MIQKCAVKIFTRPLTHSFRWQGRTEAFVSQQLSRSIGQIGETSTYAIYIFFERGNPSFHNEFRVTGMYGTSIAKVVIKEIYCERFS